MESDLVKWYLVLLRILLGEGSLSLRGFHKVPHRCNLLFVLLDTFEKSLLFFHEEALTKTISK